jgi:hypothetical protein
MKIFHFITPPKIVKNQGKKLSALQECSQNKMTAK